MASHQFSDRFRAFLCTIVLGIVLVSCGKSPVTPIAVNNSPTAPSSASGKLIVANIVSASYASSATDPDGDSVSLVFLWGDGDSDTTAFGPSGGAQSASHLYTTLGSFRIFVLARDVKGAISDSSVSTRVAVVEPRPTTPARPAGADTLYLGQRYEFTSSAVNPVGSNLALTFDWGDGQDSPLPFDTSYAIFRGIHVYYKTGVYFISALAADSSGILSEKSLSREVIVVNRPPNTPVTPFGPATVSIDSQFFAYSFATDPEFDILSLLFLWGDGGFSQTPYLSSGSVFSHGHRYLDTGLFSVRVIALDGSGRESDTSGALAIHVPNYPTRDMTITTGQVTPKYFGVRKGYKIRWLNIDSDQHRMASDSATGFLTPFIKGGDSWTVSLENRGFFTFRCLIHPNDSGEQGILSVN